MTTLNGRRLRCGLIINANYVAGPAPEGEPCDHCSRWTDVDEAELAGGMVRALLRVGQEDDEDDQPG